MMKFWKLMNIFLKFQHFMKVLQVMSAQIFVFKIKNVLIFSFRQSKTWSIIIYLTISNLTFTFNYSLSIKAHPVFVCFFYKTIVGKTWICLIPLSSASASLLINLKRELSHRGKSLIWISCHVIEEIFRRQKWFENTQGNFPF